MACRNSNCSSNNSSGSTPDDDDDQWLWRRRSGPSTPPSYEKNGTAPSTTMSSSSPDSPPLPSPYMRRTSAAAKPQRPPAHPFDERRVHNTINGRCTNTATTTNNRNVSLSMDDADDDECKDDIAAHLLAPSSSSSSCKMTTPSTTTTVAIRNPYATATSSSTFQKISNARLFIPQQQQPTTCPTTISSTGSSWSGLSPTHQEQQQPYNNTKNTKNNNSDTAAASVWDGLPVRHNLSNKERHVAAMMCMPDPTMVQFYKALLSHHSVLDYVASSSSEPKTASAAANRLWQSLCQRLELFDSAPPPTFGIESRYHHSSASTTANHNNNINDSTHNTNTNNNNNMMMHFTSRAILLVEEIRFCMAQKLGKRWKPASTPPTTATITDPRGRGVVERSSRTVVRKKRNAAELEDHLSRHFRPHPMNNDDDWLDRHLEQHLTQHHRQCMDEEDHDSSNDDDDDGDDCVSLPRTTTALPPPVYTDVVDAGTVSMEVTLETVTPILESTQRSNRKQNGNNDKFMLTFQSTKDHRKSPHCKWPIYFLPRELEHLREGEIVECLPNTTPSRWHRNNNHHHQRTIFRSILGCVISNPQSHGGSSNAAIRSFNVVVFGPPQDHRGAGDWIVRPCSLLRQSLSTIRRAHNLRQDHSVSTSPLGREKYHTFKNCDQE